MGAGAGVGDDSGRTGSDVGPAEAETQISEDIVYVSRSANRSKTCHGEGTTTSWKRSHLAEQGTD